MHRYVYLFKTHCRPYRLNAFCRSPIIFVRMSIYIHISIHHVLHNKARVSSTILLHSTLLAASLLQSSTFISLKSPSTLSLYHFRGNPFLLLSIRLLYITVFVIRLFFNISTCLFHLILCTFYLCYYSWLLILIFHLPVSASPLIPRFDTTVN